MADTSWPFRLTREYVAATEGSLKEALALLTNIGDGLDQEQEDRVRKALDTATRCIHTANRLFSSKK